MVTFHHPMTFPVPLLHDLVLYNSRQFAGLNDRQVLAFLFLFLRQMPGLPTGSFFPKAPITAQSENNDTVVFSVFQQSDVLVFGTREATCP